MGYEMKWRGVGDEHGEEREARPSTKWEQLPSSGWVNAPLAPPADAQKEKTRVGQERALALLTAFHLLDILFAGLSRLRKDFVDHGLGRRARDRLSS